MSSPCRTDVLALAAVGLLSLAGCGRQTQVAYAPTSTQDAQPVVLSELFPGGTPPPPEDPRGKAYDGNVDAIAKGKQYFGWYNCSGCHFNGGGGIGPALMDKVWIYGGRIDQIHNSISEGRPNGMPTWRGKIPDEQIWQIAAYVRSLSASSVKGEEPPSSPPQPASPPADPNRQGGATTPS